MGSCGRFEAALGGFYRIAGGLAGLLQTYDVRGRGDLTQSRKFPRPDNPAGIFSKVADGGKSELDLGIVCGKILSEPFVAELESPFNGF